MFGLRSAQRNVPWSLVKLSYQAAGSKRPHRNPVTLLAVQAWKQGTHVPEVAQEWPSCTLTGGGASQISGESLYNGSIDSTINRGSEIWETIMPSSLTFIFMMRRAAILAATAVIADTHITQPREFAIAMRPGLLAIDTFILVRRTALNATT